MENHEELPLVQQVVIALAELGWNAGIMGSVVPKMPPHAQENWDEKLEGIRDWAVQQIEEIQSFAEAFD